MEWGQKDGARENQIHPDRERKTTCRELEDESTAMNSSRKEKWPGEEGEDGWGKGRRREMMDGGGIGRVRVCGRVCV